MSSVKHHDRLDFARAVVFCVVSSYWKQLQAASGRGWPLCELPPDIGLSSVPEEATELAESIGTVASGLDVLDASYLIGVLYTGMMPGGVRARLGAYYTPPALCERLLDMATEAGVDWCLARVLDPACGGGAFLVPVARRMAESLKDGNVRAALESIQRRLNGFERDPFAAWMSQVFLDAALGDLFGEAAVRLQTVVRVCDSLEQAPVGEGFDLVVGNPPYGRITLSPELREKFRRSLFGHANLYGVFTDLALRFTRTGGVIAFVTPTSFLSGEYFKGLRRLLGREAPPVSIDFLGERKGVFADVLQETLLAAYRRGGDPGAGTVHFLSARPDGAIERTTAGAFNLPENLGEPWLMPRTEAQSALVRRVDGLPYRLADYGYTVSTGPLVWNRHRPGLRDQGTLSVGLGGVGSSRRRVAGPAGEGTLSVGLGGVGSSRRRVRIPGEKAKSQALVRAEGERMLGRDGCSVCAVAKDDGKGAMPAPDRGGAAGSVHRGTRCGRRRESPEHDQAAQRSAAGVAGGVGRPAE